jgi:ABC-type transport system involved in multi-copper enzyme maturation permease subunit
MITILKEWQEFYRSSLVYLVVGFIILSSAFVLLQFNSIDVSVSYRTGLVPVFQTSVYFLPLLSMIYGALSMSFEKNRRTLPILLARGTSLTLFVQKKFLSLYVVFLPTVVISYFIAMVPAKMVFGNIVVKELIIFLLAIIFLTTIFLSIGIMLGAWVSQKLSLIGGVVGVWLAVVYLYDLLLMYVLPMVSMDQVLGFSLLYFLSPVNAVQYFLFTQLNIYQLSDLSALYEQITFQSPWMVLIINAVLWLGISIWTTILALRRKGISHD